MSHQLVRGAGCWKLQPTNFPDTVADLTLLRRRRVKLELRVNDDRTSYLAILVGSDAHLVDVDRSAPGRIRSASRSPLWPPTVRRTKRPMAGNRLATLRPARSHSGMRGRCAKDSDSASFDVELARYQAEIAQSKALAKKRPR